MIATSARVLSVFFAAALSMSPALAATAVPPAHRVVPAVAVAPSQHVWYGTVRNIHGARFDMVLRNGHVVVVDNSVPIAAHHALLLFAGRPVIVQGAMTGPGVIRAQVVLRSHAMPAYWPADH